MILKLFYFVRFQRVKECVCHKVSHVYCKCSAHFTNLKMTFKETLKEISINLWTVMHYRTEVIRNIQCFKIISLFKIPSGARWNVFLVDIDVPQFNFTFQKQCSTLRFFWILELIFGNDWYLNFFPFIHFRNISPLSWEPCLYMIYARDGINKKYYWKHFKLDTYTHTDDQ